MSHVGVEIEDTVIEGPEARRQRRETPERVMTESPSVTVEALVPSGPTPEEALTAAQKALEEKDKVIDASNRRAATASAEAAQARDEAARARQGGATARAASLKAENDRAKADKDAARMAIKTARDAGDLDAELKAQESFNSADFRINSTAQSLEQLKGGGEMRMEDPGAGAGAGGDKRTGTVITPAAQEWIGRHPKFNSDDAYRQKMLAADGQAKLDGIIPDSPAYFRALDAAHADYERGQKRGNEGEGDHEMNEGRGGRRPASSEATPPSRQQGGHGGGARQVKTALGTVSVTRRQDGKIGIQIPPGEIRANFEEGARVTNMGLGEYALEQVRIADEVAAGGTGGLIREEGSIWK